MSAIIIVYGLALATLGYFAHSTLGDTARLTFFISLIGGGGCLLLGGAAWAGYKKRVWWGLTLTAVTLVILMHTIDAWMFWPDQSGLTLGRLLITFMFLLNFGMIAYVVHGERPPEFYQRGIIDHRDPQTDSAAESPPKRHNR